LNTPAVLHSWNLSCTGFIPQTKEEGGGADPVDVFILGNSSLLPKSVISCRPVGVILTEDQGGIDPKVIAVPLAKTDPTFSAILDISDIQENVRTQLKHFIEHHKDLEEGKYMKLLGWEGKDAAKKI
jgi:inorganic pyrophosphatase